jgi:peptidoglycan/xylan/chitin deacetylase (PgdA/CDA1 family)
LKHSVISGIFLVFFLGGYLGTGEAYRVYLCIGIALIYFLVTAFGSANIQWNYFVKSQCKVADPNQILLTFDDGPDQNFTPIILDVLQQFEVKAVFFLIGEKVDRHPELVSRIIQEGHMIGNHTYSHRSTLPWLRVNKLTEEIQACSLAIKTAVGIEPLLFRPPFGVTTPRYLAALRRNKLHSVGWSVRSLDTVIKEDKVLIQKVVSALKGGDIVLLHDTQSVTARVLPDLIKLIRANKWSLAIPQNCFENQL